MSTCLYIHIGLPKTGTTYLQTALWEGRAALAAQGCLVPGDQRASSWRAASDVLGRRPKGADARHVSGAWDAMARQIRDWTGQRVVFSEELLVTATRRQVQRLVSSVGGAEVHAVVTVRDLGRVLPSLWQQEVRKGRTWTWPEFLASVQDPKQGSVNAAAAFWLRFDVEKILSTWATELGAERIHVVVLPPPGAPATTLLQRFATAVDVEPGILEGAAPTTQSNAALGQAEVEALRRLNLTLGAQLNERQYARAVVQAVIPALEARPASTRVEIPSQDWPWVETTSTALVQHLSRSGYDVIGDLDDLIPARPASATDQPAQPDQERPDESALVDPLLDALAGVCTTYANRWWKSRPHENEASGESSIRVGSAARAVTYRAKAQVLDRAEHNRALRWLTLAYLRKRR